MQLHVDDDGFVRAPAGLVYRRLTDIGGWDEWWPTMATTPAAGPGEAWHLGLGGRRGLRLLATPGDWRHDQGFRLRLEGDLVGTLELWLEEGHGGTVIHVILRAETHRRRPLRVLRLFRHGVRRGLWAFKDLVQSEVRTAAGIDQ